MYLGVSLPLPSSLWSESVYGDPESGQKHNHNVDIHLIQLIMEKAMHLPRPVCHLTLMQLLTNTMQDNAKLFQATRSGVLLNESVVFN